MQDAQPHTVIGLWKVNLEEPKSHLSDPSVIIHDISTKARIRLASANENDKQQLQWFSNACKGIPQWERRGNSQYTQADIDQV
ncbi:putative E3 ubiquitin-protein ligase XBAT35 [Rosa rugosa]|uniref:putative E3 ubiquitin-protein ligase XBAT35 n=1 Tax=Rosa rugosa TaxID=74645 RepID=UPI002B4065C5|nr:putative E3 ubiquitin-protein ligase XBAT35 [Rosa rugosa]